MLMCDQNDIGSVVDLKSIDGENKPMVLFFDNVPGGIGFSASLYEIYPQLMANAILLIQQCDCLEGCPACVGTSGELGPGGKEETLRLLQEMNSG
jgi:DEAD/DEAH box helicase domain-containing protein